MKHDHEEKPHCDHCETKKTPWYRQRFYQVIILTVIALLVSTQFPALYPFNTAFWEFFRLMWWAILLGFLLGGLIDAFVPDVVVSRTLAGKKKRVILYATGLGFFMSACSHGILALAIQLYKKGAGVPAVIAFLLASPWANLPVTLLLFSFFGAKAFLLIIGAIVIAIITGFAYRILDSKNKIEKGKTVKDEGLHWKEAFKKHNKNVTFVIGLKRTWKGAWSLTKMVFWWILLGLLLASIARAYVPAHLFHQYLGASLLGLFLTIIIATIIEVCSEGSSPLAFELYRQTGAFGNSFAFLMAGVATDYTEIGLIWSNIGRRTAIWLPIITLPQILLLAWVFNALL